MSRYGPGEPPADPLLVALLRVIAFQFVLILLAFCLGVDLERESRSAVAISLEVWVVGTLGGTAGYLIGRGGRTPRAARAHRG